MNCRSSVARIRSLRRVRLREAQRIHYRGTCWPALDPNREESQLIDVHGVTTSTEASAAAGTVPDRHWIKNNRTSGGDLLDQRAR